MQSNTHLGPLKSRLGGNVLFGSQTPRSGTLRPLISRGTACLQLGQPRQRHRPFWRSIARLSLHIDLFYDMFIWFVLFVCSCLFACLLVCLFVCLFVCLCCLSVCLFVCLLVGWLVGWLVCLLMYIFDLCLCPCLCLLGFACSTKLEPHLRGIRGVPAVGSTLGPLPRLPGPHSPPLGFSPKPTAGRFGL